MRRPVFATLLAVAATLDSVPVRAAVILGTPKPVFVGIDLRPVEINGSHGFAAEIDLRAPGIGFTGSQPAPAGMPLAGASLPQQAETVAQTTSRFLIGSGAEVATNSGFFAPCCTAANEGKDVIGLTVTNGRTVSPLDPTRPASLLISPANQALVGTFIALPADFAIADAFTGSDILVDRGANVVPTANTDFNKANPRTAVGASADRRTLHLVTIDGRQPGYSTNTSLAETGDVLLALGAFDGLNLDRDGSTAMVIANGAGGATLINRPSGGAERYNGGNLGVFALALPVPKPYSITMLTVGLVGLAAGCRTWP